MSTSNRAELLAPALAVVGLLLLAGDGLGVYLSGDDLMNLHGYWQAPWAELLKAQLLIPPDYYRPLGGLFYRGLHGLFGLDPVGFRLACFGLLAANLFVAYAVVRRLTASSVAAGVAVALLGYHPKMADLYYNGGTVYELLCFLFYFGALLVYLGSPDGRRSWRREVAIAALYLCALNAKEMAVTLPVVLALYEFWLAPRTASPWKGLPTRLRTIALLSALTAVYVAGKLLGPGALVGNSAYEPRLSAAAYLESSAHYAGQLLYLDSPLSGWQMGLVWLGMAAGAWLLRSRLLAFALCFVLAAILPIAFIDLRSAFVYYLPALGWALYIGAVAGLVIERLMVRGRLAAGAGKGLRGAAALLLASLALTPLRLADSGSIREMVLGGIAPIAELAGGLEPHRATLREASSVLMLDDEFEDWSPYFLLRLINGRRDTPMLRVQASKGQRLAAAADVYGAVVRFGPGALRVERSTAPPAARREPIAVTTLPEVVRAGESYMLEIPELAGRTIDLSVWGGRGFFRRSTTVERFCTLDAEGRAEVETSAEQAQGLFAIRGVRIEGERWREAAGRIEVLPRSQR